MKKILLATPMMPPTLGGPAIHAERVSKHLAKNGYEVEVFNFEKLNKLPPGVRHFVAFILIAIKSLNKDLIFAFDGFSVAIPTVLVGILLRKKVIIRTVGDLIHEQYIETDLEIPMNDFYPRILDKTITLNFIQKIKLRLQKFALENCYGIILASDWQKKIFEEYYNLPKKIWIFANQKEDVPVELVKEDTKRFVFVSATRDVAFKNLKRLKNAFKEAKKELAGKIEIHLDTQISSRIDLLNRTYNARAYICASISDMFPNTVVDALSLGTPIIITKNTGLTDFIKNGETGIFIDPFDEISMKKAILSMCDENVWAHYKKQLQSFNWPETWDSLLNRYVGLIDSETQK